MTQENTAGLPERIDGLLVRDAEENKLIRIIDERRGYVRAVEIHPTQLNILVVESLKFGMDSAKGRYQVVEEEPRVVVESSLNERDKKAFHDRLEIIAKLKEILNGDLLDFGSREKGAEINKMLKDHGTNRRNFRIWVLRYLQSGQQKWALLNQFKARNGRKPVISRNIKNKLGKKPRVERGKILDEYDRKVFEELLRTYKKNIGKRSFRECWWDIRQQFYNELTITGKGTPRLLVPVTQIPTEQQARYYVDQRMTPEEKILARKTKREAFNDNRLLNSDSRHNVFGPMAVCESDAWEPGLILVDPKDPSIRLGKPSIIALIDVYTSAIVSFYITYDKDTSIALASLMLSLLDDKSSLKEGRENPEEVWFPGSYLPTCIRIDKGSNYTSDAYGAVCNRLGIVKDTVSGGRGSYKPNVERLWGRIEERLISHLDKRGAVTHQHGEKPYKDALFTMSEFRRIVEEAVIELNSEPVPEYPVDSDMIRAHVDLTPKSLWEYGVRKYGEPRGIVNREQYMLDLLLEDTAKVNRAGTLFKGLYYDNPEDKRLQNMRYKTQKKKIPITIRFDPRCVNDIWYRWDDEPSYRRMSLMSDKTGMDSFRDMPFQKYMVYRKLWQTVVAQGELVKDRNKSAAYLAEKNLTDTIAESRKDRIRKDSKPTHEDVFNAKMEERAENAIAKQLYALSSEELDPADAVIPEETPLKEKNENTRWAPKGYENALAMFDDDDD